MKVLLQYGSRLFVNGIEYSSLKKEHYININEIIFGNLYQMLVVKRIECPILKYDSSDDEIYLGIWTNLVNPRIPKKSTKSSMVLHQQNYQMQRSNRNNNKIFWPWLRCLILLLLLFYSRSNAIQTWNACIVRST
jgi:hypothetical protein